MKSIVTLKLTVLIISLLLILSGCEDPKAFPCEKGEGERVTETRTVAGFNHIILNAPGDLYISKGQYFDLEITAQEDILEILQTEVTGNILEIRNDRCIRQSKTIEINLTLPEVNFLEIQGSGSIYGLDRFSSNELDLLISGSGNIEWASDAGTARLEIKGSGDIVFDVIADEIFSKTLGSGDIKLSGSTVAHDINIDASGHVKGFDLITDNTNVNIAASGNCEVFANNELDVKILGSGNVYYRGTPNIDVKITGSGQLVNDN